MFVPLAPAGKISAWEIVKQNFKFSWARLFQKSGSSPPPVTTRTQNFTFSPAFDGSPAAV
jgi:hypothetical protein